MRRDPVRAKNATSTSTQLLYFRGGAILQAVVAQLIARHQLDAATDVVVGGASAGGLSAYLHADKFTAALPSATRVTSLPDSGFFLQIGMNHTSPHASASSGGSGNEKSTSTSIKHRSTPLTTINTNTAVATNPGTVATVATAAAAAAATITVGSSSNNNSGLIPGEYAACMKAMTIMANSTAALNPACVAVHGWKCIFAQVAALYLTTPTFALQSAYDSWQLENEMQVGNASSNIAAANAYGKLLRRAMYEALPHPAFSQLEDLEEDLEGSATTHHYDSPL